MDACLQLTGVSEDCTCRALKDVHSTCVVTSTTLKLRPCFFLSDFPTVSRSYFTLCISYYILFVHYKYFVFYNSVILLHILILYSIYTSYIFEGIKFYSLIARVDVTLFRVIVFLIILVLILPRCCLFIISNQFKT